MPGPQNQPGDEGQAGYTEGWPLPPTRTRLFTSSFMHTPWLTLLGVGNVAGVAPKPPRPLVHQGLLLSPSQP